MASSEAMVMTEDGLVPMNAHAPPTGPPNARPMVQEQAPQPGPANLMGSSDNFYRFASRRSDVDPSGHFDVIAHGTSSEIEILTPKGPVMVDQRVAAKLIQQSPGYNGQPIRLLSCETGACEAGFAQNLANKMNVPVQAPNELLWAYENGKMVVAPRLSTNPRSPDYNSPDLSKIGSFKTFTPKKTQE
jgi:filamentous hemagglutinin